MRLSVRPDSGIMLSLSGMDVACLNDCVGCFLNIRGSKAIYLSHEGRETIRIGCSMPECGPKNEDTGILISSIGGSMPTKAPSSGSPGGQSMAPRLAELRNITKTRPRTLNPSIIKTLSIVQSHSHDPTLWLHRIASCLNRNPDYLSRRFKREVGINFHQYVLLLRMNRAIPLLVSTRKSIKEITYDTGFSSPEVFSKAFKRLLGCSPRAYRQNGNTIFKNKGPFYE